VEGQRPFKSILKRLEKGEDPTEVERGEEGEREREEERVCLLE